MIDNDEIIENSCDATQWADFERKIEILEPHELTPIAERLGLAIDPSEPWQTFRDQFARQSWHDFTEAYEHIMRTAF